MVASILLRRTSVLALTPSMPPHRTRKLPTVMMALLVISPNGLMKNRQPMEITAPMQKLAMAMPPCSRVSSVCLSDIVWVRYWLSKMNAFANFSFVPDASSALPSLRMVKTPFSMLAG